MPAKAATTSRATTRRSSSWASARDKLLYVVAIVERIPLDQIVRKTVVFCDEKRPDFVGIEAEQFQELLVHEFRRQCGEQFDTRWPMYKTITRGVPKIARIRRLSQYVINWELRFRADSPGCRLPVDQLMDFFPPVMRTGATPWKCVSEFQ